MHKIRLLIPQEVDEGLALHVREGYLHARSTMLSFMYNGVIIKPKFS